MQEVFWLALIVGFLLAEGISVAVISLWFAFGALGALIVTMAGGTVLWQWVTFFAISIVLLLLLRPVTKKWFTPRLTRTNVDSLPGKEGIITEAVDNLTATGRVKVGAMDWTARSTDDSTIPVGTRVKVERIEGVKAYVSPVSEKVSN